MNGEAPFRVAFLTGSDSKPVRDAIEAVCGLPGIQPVAVLLDGGQSTLRRRLKNFRNNVRRDGVGYPVYRVLGVLRHLTDALVMRSVVHPAEVSKLLRKAFPERVFQLEELAQKYSFEIFRVPNLNDSAAIAKLRSVKADLGIVLGTRVLRKSVFGVPRLGCINLHKGQVPDYRGFPPGFWELYDGRESARITVHFVDSGLDTGDVIATASVPIEALETPDTLLEKLHSAGTAVLTKAVAAIQSGSCERRPQTAGSAITRTKPGRKQVAELRARLPHWKTRDDTSAIVKNIYSLAIYWLGIYAAARAWHRFRGSRAAIFLHHRVNDYAGDVLTTDTKTFAAQLLALRARYPAVGTEELIGKIGKKQEFPATSVAVHFDDCYRDVLTNGAPILNALDFPAVFFVSSGFLDSDRVFDHDEKKYPFRFANLSSAELRAWSATGLSVGAHTVNHIDLGTCPAGRAEVEIVQSGSKLAEVLEKPVTMFSFPFGGVKNIRNETLEIVMKSGYEALFSAHGGFVDRSTSLSDIPRLGCSGQTRPLYLLLEVEGLGPSQLKQALFNR